MLINVKDDAAVLLYARTFPMELAQVYCSDHVGICSLMHLRHVDKGDISSLSSS
jgi:hypothetical protein